MKKINKKIMKETKKSKTWLWLIVGFVLGLGVGYISHYLVINWNSFFVICEDGKRPNSNGCCEGETFTDAGGGWMVCCPAQGEHCFPPLK